MASIFAISAQNPGRHLSTFIPTPVHMIHANTLGVLARHRQLERSQCGIWESGMILASLFAKGLVLGFWRHVLFT